ncbi:unnamed protein product [Oncorhynchus mykiss]|uniref:Uncharacterized protein n=1 Tax=Oncorhynchus mykiss TaxID=8022 RepID=A0A060WF99_ONCMY|nr:unnamed protein product [Oncorhynchus mykiss]
MGDVSVARIQEDQDGIIITGKLKIVNCSKEMIRALSCGDSHTGLLSEEGRVLCLDKNIPSWVPFHIMMHLYIAYPKKPYSNSVSMF